MIPTYENAMIVVDGKPLAQVSVTFDEHQESVGETAATPPIGDYTFTTTCKGFDALSAFVAARESPALKMTIPWGILGPIDVVGWVDDSRFAQDEKGTTATLGMVANENAIRRAVSMAVERAITNMYQRDRTVVRALEVRSPVFGRMAHRMGFSRPGGCYRGERQQRKAMRRLLRAAGITVEKHQEARSVSAQKAST